MLCTRAHGTTEAFTQCTCGRCWLVGQFYIQLLHCWKRMNRQLLPRPLPFCTPQFAYTICGTPGKKLNIPLHISTVSPCSKCCNAELPQTLIRYSCTHCFVLHCLPCALLLVTILPIPPPTSVCARAHATFMHVPITRDNQQLRLLRNERKTAVRRTATRRDGAFEESLLTSE